MEYIKFWSPPLVSLDEEEEPKPEVLVSVGTRKSEVEDESGSGLDHVEASSASNDEDMDDKHIIQLTSTNYQRWKYEIQAILESKEVQDIVDGTEAKPTDPSKLKVWRKGDATARMVLSRSLDEEHHSFIRACKTSAEIWTTLVTIKERTNSSTKLIASQDFAALRFDPGTTVGSFLAACNAIIGKMESSGILVDDATKIGKVLHCLPMEYDSFRQSWRLTKDDKATFTDLQSQLLATEADIKSRDPLVASGGEAFYGKNVNGGANRNRKSKYDSDAADKKEKARKKNIVCFNCNKKGHYKRECRQLKQKDESDTSREEDSDNGFVVSDQAFPGLEADQWLGDSGASSHITSHREWFVSFKETSPHPIRVGGDKVLNGRGIGTIMVDIFDGKSWSRSNLLEVRFVPEFGSVNLFSLGSVVRRKMFVTMDANGTCIKRGRKTLIVGRLSGTMTIMGIRTVVPESALVAKSCSLRLWHERLGHISTQTIRTMVKNDLVNGLELDKMSKDDFFCKGCVLGAMVRGTHKAVVDSRDCKPGEFIHADVCGPTSEPSIGGSKYFVCYKDEASGYRRVFCIKDKSQVLGTFKTFCTEVAVDTGRKVAILRTDNGTEFFNNDH